MIKMSAYRIHSGKQGGAVLLEALIAVLVFSIGILGVVALQANMIQATGDAKYRAEANFIAQKHIGEIWANQANINTSCGAVDIDIAESSGLPGATMSTVCGCNGGDPTCYTVTVTWIQPGTGIQHSATTMTHVTRDN